MTFRAEEGMGLKENRKKGWQERIEGKEKAGKSRRKEIIQEDLRKKGNSRNVITIGAEGKRKIGERQRKGK
jgi:hypothetical protein